MKYIKIMGLCLVAMFALSAVVAASASAKELELVKAGTKEALKKNKFKGETGKGILETEKNGKIECTKTKFEGTVESTKSGTVTITFTGCVGLGFKCNTVGSATGEIKTSVSLGLVYNPAENTILLLFTLLPLTEPKTVTLECTALQKLIIKGGFVTPAIGLKLNTKETEVEVHAKQTKGVQEFTKFKKETGEAEKTIFFETEGKGIKAFAFEKSGEETEAVKTKFEEEFEVIEN